ncbi:THAP domain-containing protein 4-like [Temnothorax curvispinosus]|uniref:THAP domain-containing protein 4-like n=1 Tax=Temnothorax curvispinosus TaxID=300111 RepID=A0A6J1R1U6_9HYME|nr:THAP domain-containing protein 4-like [Temnothorax curvispinosus]
MGGCAAEFCNNSSAKGYIMKIFPRDKHRREQWVKNMNRPNWTPTNSSYLCEVHFAPEMWEPNRIDNKRKLKPHAVPTIFGFFITKRVSFQEPIHRENLQKPTENLVEREHIIHDVQNQDQSEQEVGVR